MEKQKSIPTLRFHEFSDEWNKRRLGDLAEVYDGTHQTPNYVETGVPFYSVEQITSNDFTKTKFVSQEVFDKENDRVRIEKGDILMTRIGDIGTSRYIDWDVKASFYVSIALIKQSNRFNSQYLNHYIGTNNFQCELWNRTIHVAFPKKINLGEISNCFVYFPSILEQNKIASFLTSVNIRLNQLKKKEALLKQYKLGVMQQIFNRVIRFKDDDENDFPEWEKKKLGDVTISLQSGKDKAELTGEYNLYGSMGIIGKCSNFTYDGNLILIARVGANAGTINLVSGKFCVTDNTLVLKVSKEIDVNYCYFLLLYQNLNKLVFGSGQPLITSGQLKNESIFLPCLFEQTKIANFLSAIDEKINCCSNQIEKTEQYKKGLLQQMFC